jgi:hypothetical protein
LVPSSSVQVTSACSLTVKLACGLGCAAGATHRLVVRAHGDNVDVWLNDQGVGLDEDGLTDDAHAGATGVGVAFGPEGASPTVRRIAVWPRKVILPPQVGPFPPPPDAGSEVVARDTFGAPTGTRLQDHRPARGGPWQENSGTWTIEDGQTVPPLEGGMATMETSLTDMAVTVGVALAASGQGYGTTNGWEVGPVLRYTDSDNYIWARFLYQGGSPEIELWERNAGKAQLLNARNITGLVHLGERHTMRVAVKGRRVAVYLDGDLVAEGTTTVSGGTKAGMVIDNEAVNLSTFTAFEVHAIAPAQAGVPSVPITYGEDVEAWWARHPFNPQNPSSVPIGGITSPEPVLNVRSGFDGNVQAAIDALPAAGGTLYFEPGTYTGEFVLTGRSNVHFVGANGAILRPGSKPTMGQIAGCQLALDYGAFTRAVRLAHDPQHDRALACVRDRARNIYFRNLIFDGAERANTALELHAVADVLFDQVTLRNFVNPRVSHGGLIDGSAMLDNVWCRGCHFVGQQQWAQYLDGLHGGGVINSRIENGFAVGGLLYLTNDDYSNRLTDENTWQPQEIRTGAYIVVYGNTFAGGNYQGLGMAARNVLVARNVVEGPLARGFAGFDTKSSMINPELVYEYYGNKVIGNRTQDLSGLAGFNQETGTHNPAWNNRARIGRYTVKDNVVEDARQPLTLVHELGRVDGPNTVENNCANGRVDGTDRACAPAP